MDSQKRSDGDSAAWRIPCAAQVLRPWGPKPRHLKVSNEPSGPHVKWGPVMLEELDLRYDRHPGVIR